MIKRLLITVGQWLEIQQLSYCKMNSYTQKTTVYWLVSVEPCSLGDTAVKLTGRDSDSEGVQRRFNYSI